MLKVAIMLLSPPKYSFSTEIEISAIVPRCNGKKANALGLQIPRFISPKAFPEAKFSYSTVQSRFSDTFGLDPQKLSLNRIMSLN